MSRIDRRAALVALLCALAAGCHADRILAPYGVKVRVQELVPVDSTGGWTTPRDSTWGMRLEACGALDVPDTLEWAPREVAPVGVIVPLRYDLEVHSQYLEPYGESIVLGNRDTSLVVYVGRGGLFISGVPAVRVRRCFIAHDPSTLAEVRWEERPSLQQPGDTLFSGSVSFMTDSALHPSVTVVARRRGDRDAAIRAGTALRFTTRASQKMCVGAWAFPDLYLRVTGIRLASWRPPPTGQVVCYGDPPRMVPIDSVKDTVRYDNPWRPEPPLPDSMPSGPASLLP